MCKQEELVSQLMELPRVFGSPDDRKMRKLRNKYNAKEEYPTHRRSRSDVRLTTVLSAGDEPQQRHQKSFSKLVQDITDD